MALKGNKTNAPENKQMRVCNFWGIWGWGLGLGVLQIFLL